MKRGEKKKVVVKVVRKARRAALYIENENKVVTFIFNHQQNGKSTATATTKATNTKL